MDKVLACIDASAYAASVCDLAAWASRRLQLPIELLHVVQRKDAVAERRDLSGAIGLGVAKLLGQDPESRVREDLRRFKRIMETGDLITTQGQPSGRTEEQP